MEAPSIHSSSHPSSHPSILWLIILLRTMTSPISAFQSSLCLAIVLQFLMSNKFFSSIFICLIRHDFFLLRGIDWGYKRVYFLQYGVANTIPYPQPGGPGNLQLRFSSPSLWKSNSIYYKAAVASYGLPRVFYFPDTRHFWWAFPYPPPGEAPDGRQANPHGHKCCSLWINPCQKYRTGNVTFYPTLVVARYCLRIGPLVEDARINKAEMHQ